MGKAHFPRSCFLFLRLANSFRRCPLSRRTLIIASVCVVYLFFVASHVGSSQQNRHRRINNDKYRHTRGLYHLGITDAPPDAVDLETGASSVVPTRSNVVYITLRSKRLKPANIRGTVRPKLRRKMRRNKTTNSAFTQEKLETLERDARHDARDPALGTSWGNTRDVDIKSVEISHISHPNSDTHSSSIRIYSQRAPPWFSPQDVRVMRFLADAKVLRLKKVSHGDSSSFLMFEGESGVSSTQHRYAQQSSMCVGQCGLIRSPVDTAEVFAFHLDRVLGLNRTVPAVSRKFNFLHDGQPCPVVSWDASLHTEALAAGKSTVRLTWGAYQSSLKHRCWHRNMVPKSDSGCSTIHHYEWSKLALFDFLLQIHSRLDQSCCGFRPRVGDVCVEQEDRAECRDGDRLHLANIVHRTNDPRHLVFTDNKGFFDRNEDNLDFRLLEGIKELPEQAVSVLRSRRLREKLLQSLFLDQTYWESQGGRQGIDKLIDVIERRAKVLLTYINAHGILVTAMNA